MKKPSEIFGLSSMRNFAKKTSNAIKAHFVLISDREYNPDGKPKRIRRFISISAIVILPIVIVLTILF